MGIPAGQYRCWELASEVEIQKHRGFTSLAKEEKILQNMNTWMRTTLYCKGLEKKRLVVDEKMLNSQFSLNPIFAAGQRSCK